jgi:hypothetical protein
MKANTFIAVVLLMCVGCTSQQNDQLTQQQKDQIKKEIKVVFDSVVARAERLDVGSTIQYYWDSPEFLAINPDGSQTDIQAMKKTLAWFDDSVSAFKLATVREEFPIVTKDLVLYAWVGNDEITLKSGDKIKYDPDAQTFVFRKLDGEWKMAYFHESATITTQKAGKK